MEWIVKGQMYSVGVSILMSHSEHTKQNLFCLEVYNFCFSYTTETSSSGTRVN